MEDTNSSQTEPIEEKADQKEQRKHPKASFRQNVKQKVALFGIIIVVILIFVGIFIKIEKAPQKQDIHIGPTPSVSPIPTIDTSNWKKYIIKNALIVAYPPTYDTFVDPNTGRIDIYDKKESLGPANTYLSISVDTPQDAYYKSINTNEYPLTDGEVDIRKKSNVPGADLRIKHGTVFVRAFYNSSSITPGDVYNQILSTFKFTDQTISGTPTLTAKVTGTILLAPTCPLARPGQNCSQPYQGIVFVRSTDGKTITQFTTDVNGNFSVNLSPGSYIFVRQDQPAAFNASTAVTITQTNMTNLKITFDTGIR